MNELAPISDRELLLGVLDAVLALGNELTGQTGFVRMKREDGSQALVLSSKEVRNTDPNPPRAAKPPVRVPAP